MEPEKEVEMADIAPIFVLFDLNSDGRVTMEEVASYHRLKISTKAGPKQLHLGLTNQDGEMQIMWVTTPEEYSKPIVKYGKVAGLLNQRA